MKIGRYFQLTRYFLAKQKETIAILSILIFLMVFCSGVLPIAIRNLVDLIVYNSKLQDSFHWYALLLFFLFISNFLLKVIYETKLIQFKTTLEKNIIHDLTIKIVHAPYKALNTINSGDLFNRVAIDARVFFEVINNLFFVWVKNLLHLVIYISLLIYFVGWYALLIFFITPCMILLYIKFDRDVGKHSSNYSKQESDVYTFIKRITLNIKFLKSSNSTTALTRFFTEQLNAFSSIKLKILTSEAYAIQSYKLIELIVYICFFFLGLYLVHLNKATVGTLMALLSFIREFIAATRVYANYFTKFRIASGYFERLLETWHFPDERAINKDKTAVTSIKTIDVKPFDFAYDNKTIISIPKTMAFYKGSKYAIVGETGSGKSTFVSLLLKLLPVEANKVFFNQQDSQEINTESLYEKTGFLLQDDYFFDMTILENILLGENNLESKLIRLIKNFQLEDFFLNLEKGLQTKIVNNGANLSGGQKRIISLLRALVREPDILIFDEITNGMDIKLKEKFFCFINKTVSEKILLFITHDQAYLSWFDKVVFINKSKVYLDTHQSLLETNNDYKKMLKNHSI